MYHLHLRFIKYDNLSQVDDKYRTALFANVTIAQNLLQQNSVLFVTAFMSNLSTYGNLVLFLKRSTKI